MRLSSYPSSGSATTATTTFVNGSAKPPEPERGLDAAEAASQRYAVGEPWRSSTPASIAASLISETSLLIADTAGYAQRPGPVDQVRSASSNNAAGSTESAALRISMPAKRP